MDPGKGSSERSSTSAKVKTESENGNVCDDTRSSSSLRSKQSTMLVVVIAVVYNSVGCSKMPRDYE